MIGANQCQHGRLSHKCQLCDDEAEIEQLKAQVRVLREALHGLIGAAAVPSADRWESALDAARAALEAK